MPRDSRLEKLKTLEELVRSPVYVYITSTRPGVEAQMGMDAIRFMYEHLRQIPEKLDTINLFIHSNGGEGTVPWKLVSLIREHCEKFRVLVPYRAFSAATLTALGADEIFMHPMGMLGPTDPSITGPYNPRSPEGAILPISVEEVLAYIALVREDAGINHEDQVVQAIGQLASNVHPIALGSVKRSHAQSRMIAKKLMGLVTPEIEEHRIDDIVANLTSKLYYHGHPINREEAKHLGLQVKDCDLDVETAMWNLYEEYETDMEMLVPWHQAQTFIRLAPKVAPGSAASVTVPTIRLVMIESRHRCDTLSVQSDIFGAKDETGGVSTQWYITRQGWEREA